MGDTRIVDGQMRSYFLAFGLVEYKGKNECIFEEDMYENGNKIEIMGQSDGDINKIVGSMDWGCNNQVYPFLNKLTTKGASKIRVTIKQRVKVNWIRENSLEVHVLILRLFRFS